VCFVAKKLSPPIQQIVKRKKNIEKIWKTYKNREEKKDILKQPLRIIAWRRREFVLPIRTVEVLWW